MTLTFNAPALNLTGAGALLTVTGPDGGSQHFETGCAAISGSTISAPVSLGIGGRYTVTYQAVSSDGHTVSNSYAFAYQPPPGSAAAAGSATTLCGATAALAGPEPTAHATTEPAPAATDTASTLQPAKASDENALGLVIGIAIAIVVLALAAVVVVLTAHRKTPASDGDVEEAAEGDSGSGERR
ncbi:conserved hypothetical protein [Leifsonia xyli subsp. xyli str. CTCB07]|uniref:CopC domain-containing protein n=1 Tax=Leifsonia xyli subsp. xyli (strain CTCB07) TaxID=281090 RepID=Q6AHJ7_LEIXX|nr:conserved hypothetical protein [Leifsonia xyli subsp. xyli str. CTCB07]